MANGSGFISSSFLLNPLLVSVTGQLSFFGDDGTPLALSVNGQAAASQVPFLLPPHGGAIFQTSGAGPLVAGSARADADGAIGGVLSFVAPGLGIAGVGASAPLSGFITPVRRSQARGLSTGVAITAAGNGVVLTLTLPDRNGDAVTNGLPLSANGHLAKFIQELFPTADLSNFDGTLTVVAAGGTIAATAIELGSTAGEFTTLPVAALR